MNNNGFSWREIKDAIVIEGYKGCDSLLRTYLAKIKKEKNEVMGINQVVERTTMISLLYKEIEEVPNITKELFDKIIKMFPEAGKIYEVVTEFKEIMFSKKETQLETWINKTRELKIPEINSFINRNRKRYRCCKKRYKI